MISLFWLSAVGLLLVASVFVVLPLWWSVKREGEGVLAQAEGNLQLHEERLQELGQALSAGEITEAEYSGQVEDQSLVLLEDAGPLLAEDEAVQRVQGASRGSKPVFFMGLVFLALASTVWFSDAGWSQGALTELTFTESLQQNRDVPRSKAELEEMASGLEAIRALSPDNEQVGFYLGQLQLTLGDFDRAVEIFTPLAERYPEDGDLAVALAESRYLQQGRQLTQDLNVLFERAVNLKPNSVSLLEILGMEAFKRGDTARAKRFFERALNFADGERAKLIATVLEGLPAASESVETDLVADASQDDKPMLGPRRVRVTVSKDPALEVNPALTVYIFAKAVSGPPMPLAVVKRKVSDLPLQVVLDESMAMMAGFSIADFDQIIVTAKISETGLATPSLEDRSVESAAIQFDQSEVGVALVLR
ncbi:MAG: c-type cytochrome biogenesis protein CcmI [Pseudomonadales bacterium]|nr:c-type cytochrome biogenesis protein CcmI [Pseudomonadales bacterium]